MTTTLTQDARRNACMLTGSFARQGYDWWWHSFTGTNVATGERKAFFIEYFLCNPVLGGAEPVLGQLPENKHTGKRPSYLMVKCGCWGSDARQMHRFFGWDAVKVAKGAPYSVEAGDCFASDRELRGSVRVVGSADHPEWMCSDGEMSWNLQVDKKIAFNVGYGASAFFRAIKAFEMYWHAEGMKTLYSGSVTLDGTEYRISPEDCFGYADKNWGRNFTSPWVWLSSCNLRSLKTGRQLTGSVFDIGGGCPKVYFVPLKRKLLGALCYEGQAFEFNFSKFWTGSRTQFSSEETDAEILWHVRQENRKAVMQTEMRCSKSEMLLVKYESPDGAMRHTRLWNGGTGHGTVTLWRKTRRSLRFWRKPDLELIDEIEAQNVGCEYGEYGDAAHVFADSRLWNVTAPECIALKEEVGGAH